MIVRGAAGTTAGEMRWFRSTSPRDLRPAGALLHPVFLGALVVLALNDHVLKGSGALPGAVTGKLSDFAGMLVAPLLLATVLRLRGRVGWAAAHVAVGVVFAAIQVAPWVADGWSSMMAALGVPWVITMDPTDLVALPMLAVGWAFFPGVMDRSARSNLRRAAQWGVASTGLACCMATSRATPGEPEPWPEDTATDGDWGDTGDTFVPSIRADVWLHNATEDEIVVRIRELDSSVELDCDAIESDPGRLLTQPLFDEVQSWTIPSDANVAVLQHGAGSRDCYAAWVEADGLSPRILFWRDGDPRQRDVDGQGLADDTGAVVIAGGFDGVLVLDDLEAGIAFAPTQSPETAPECAPQGDGDRLAFDADIPLGTHALVSVGYGLDGCYAFALGDVESQSVTRTWYACMPADVMPFLSGDVLTIDFDPDQGDAVVRLRAEPTADMPARTLWLVTRNALDQPLPELDLQLAALPLFDCGLQAHASCGTVTRNLKVAAYGTLGEIELLAGDPTASLEGADGERIDVALMHADERVLVDHDCTMGAQRLGADVELAIAHSAAL